MSRYVLMGALIVGAASVFRRDLARVVNALRAPATTFIQDVRRELEERPTGDASSGSAGDGSGAAKIGDGGSASGAGSDGAAARNAAVPPPRKEGDS